MKTIVSSLIGIFILTSAACVTINVYFPEAEAEQAIDQFIDGVIGDAKASDSNRDGAEPRAAVWHWSQLLMSAAYAQVNIDINTPEIRAIQARMKQRFDSQLGGFFNSGAVGFNNRAMIEIRNLGAVSLKDRNKLKATVAADNKDREAVYREIAVANGHPEWEGQIRQTAAERWIAKARAGWYYQNSAGAWQQK